MLHPPPPPPPRPPAPRRQSPEDLQTLADQIAALAQFYSSITLTRRAVCPLAAQAAYADMMARLLTGDPPLPGPPEPDDQGVLAGGAAGPRRPGGAAAATLGSEPAC